MHTHRRRLKTLWIGRATSKTALRRRREEEPPVGPSSDTHQTYIRTQTQSWAEKVKHWFLFVDYIYYKNVRDLRMLVGNSSAPDPPACSRSRPLSPSNQNPKPVPTWWGNAPPETCQLLFCSKHSHNKPQGIKWGFPVVYCFFLIFYKCWSISFKIIEILIGNQPEWPGLFSKVIFVLNSLKSQHLASELFFLLKSILWTSMPPIHPNYYILLDLNASNA